MALPHNAVEAGPQVLAGRLLFWLRQRGYELPGDDKDWYLLKPELGYGQSRRSQYDVERGVMAWYLSYTGEDEAAQEWSEVFGGEMTPSSLINRLDMVTLEEVRGTDGGRYSFFAGLKLVLSEEAIAAMPPKMKTVYIFKCSKCGYRTEDHRKDFGDRYVHAQCGQDSRYTLIDSVKVEVARTT